MEEKELSFEKALTKLEEIVKELENGSELEQAIDKYTEAMQLIKYCNEKLTTATDKVNKILNENGTLSEFKIEE